MDKIARINLCNKLSPGRFNKTAGFFGRLLKAGIPGLKNINKLVGNTASKLFSPLPTNGGATNTGFLGSALEGLTTFYNPKNIVKAFRYGPGTFVKELKDTTFNMNAWKENPLGNLLSTYGNYVGPYWAISTALDDSPANDTEGTVQKGMRHFMNFTDLADLSGRVMMGSAGNMWGYIPGLMIGRYVLPRVIGKKIDDWLGTGPTKEVLQQRFMDRMNKEIPKFIKENPNVNPNEAQYIALQNVLGEYGDEAVQKIFS